ncbi:MAG: helix-turn-helix transcriptional regulator [Thermoplasmata archaeon]|nr:helix-turn-helix transcriptional regulator [Thermoplasmata archaeon]
MFIPDSTFKNVIVQELKKGDKSISSLYRALNDEGYKVHRLVITGYLKAMEEMGVLTSREFPPSKVYSISASAEKDIYETVGNICMNLELPIEKKAEVAFYFFQKLFHRPIFLGEMVRAGFEVDPESFAVKISTEERQEVKKLLAKKGFKLPHRDPAFQIIKVKYDQEFDDIIQQMLLQKFKASNLSIGTKQTKLGL